LREGDTLKITRLDRLGRSVIYLVTLGAELRERGVGLHVIEQGIDTTTIEAGAMSGMLSVLVELQRDLIVASTRDGVAAARASGRRATGHEQIALAQELYDAGEHTRPADRRTLQRSAHDRPRARPPGRLGARSTLPRAAPGP
jgi:DNA invertase Pin-like site-specific DNA recombinase